MTLTIELALSLMTALLAVGGSAFGIIKWVLAELGKRDRATEELRRSLEAHKLYAAEHFATTGELATALGKVEAAIERLSLRLDELLLKGQQSGK